MRYFLLILVVMLISSLIIKGCLDSEEIKTGDQVWEEETDAIRKAGEVTRLIQDAAEKESKNADAIIKL